MEALFIFVGLVGEKRKEKKRKEKIQNNDEMTIVKKDRKNKRGGKK